MPNVISKDRKSVTFLENREVLAWMESVARERGTDLSVILREATSAYFVAHRRAAEAPGLSERRAGEKARQRVETQRRIREGLLTPAEAQLRNAPIRKPVRIVDLWSSVRRHARTQST